MQNSFRFDAKTRWLLLATTALAVYCIVPVRRGAMLDLDAVSTWLQLLLFVLTFPLGSFFVMIVNASPGGIDHFRIVDQFQMWAVAVALGFFQWFFLIPILLGRKGSEVTALNLSAGAGAPAVASARPHALADAVRADTPNAPPVPQYDARGRTPFERVLNGDDEGRVDARGAAPADGDNFSE